MQFRVVNCRCFLSFQSLSLCLFIFLEVVVACLICFRCCRISHMSYVSIVVLIMFCCLLIAGWVSRCGLSLDISCNCTFGLAVRCRWVGPHRYTRLTHLYEMPVIRVNHSLLTALVKCFHSEVNTFHLPQGEMTVMPEDIYRILWVLFHGTKVEYDT